MSDSLAELQRRLYALVVAPSGVDEALAEAGAQERRAALALVRAAPGAPAIERLEVYANAYFARIRDVLAESFPALQASLGAPLFHDLATAYLLSHPPSRPSIRRVGDDEARERRRGCIAGLAQRRGDAFGRREQLP